MSDLEALRSQRNEMLAKGYLFGTKAQRAEYEMIDAKFESARFWQHIEEIDERNARPSKGWY